MQGRANAFTTDDLCNFMCDASKGTPLQRLAALNALFLKNGGQNTTDASYKDLVEGMRMFNWSDPSVTSGGRERGGGRVEEGRKGGRWEEVGWEEEGTRGREGLTDEERWEREGRGGGFEEGEEREKEEGGRR